jgi:hypothetical protein
LAAGDRLRADADRIDKLWVGLYGATPLELQPFVPDCKVIIFAIMDSKLNALQQLTLRELVPYTDEIDGNIRLAADYLKAGTEPQFKIAPRQAASSARLAISAVSDAGAQVADIDKVVSTACAVIKSNGPKDKRAVPDIAGQAARIEKFIDDDLGVNIVERRIADPWT